MDGKGGKFAIDQKALSKVAFVKEGQFVETSGAPTLTLVGEIQERDVSNLDLYPFSYTELLSKVRNQLPEIKQNEFNQLIRDNNIKTNRAYSSVRYTSTVKQKKFNENKSVIQLVNLMKKNWSSVKWKIKKNNKNKESKLLKLNSTKAKKKLNWKPLLSFNEGVKLTADWYKMFYSRDYKTFELSKNQILNYENKIKKK